MGSLSFMFCPTSAYNQGLLKLSLADIRNPVSDSVLQKINVKCVVFFFILMEFWGEMSHLHLNLSVNEVELFHVEKNTDLWEVCNCFSDRHPPVTCRDMVYWADGFRTACFHHRSRAVSPPRAPETD